MDGQVLLLCAAVGCTLYTNGATWLLSRVKMHAFTLTRWYTSGEVRVEMERWIIVWRGTNVSNSLYK